MRLLFMCLAVIGAAVSLTLGSAYALLSLIFWEPDSADQWSLAYLLAIPQMAKNFPLWGTCDEARYSYRFQDGLSPEAFWFVYPSRLSKTDLSAAFNAHAGKISCSPMSQSRSGLSDGAAETVAACRTPEHEITVRAAAPTNSAKACAKVSITFVARSL